jgi:hypothetical protein
MLVQIKQRADRHAKCFCKLVDNRDRGVAGAALEIADIGAVNVGLPGKMLLRPVLRIAKPAQVQAEALDNIHEREITVLSTINLQTISDIPLD